MWQNDTGSDTILNAEAFLNLSGSITVIARAGVFNKRHRLRERSQPRVRTSARNSPARCSYPGIPVWPSETAGRD
jgi:hypothetical protein